LKTAWKILPGGFWLFCAEAFGKTIGAGLDEGFGAGFEQPAQGGERFLELGLLFALDESFPMLFAKPFAQIFAVLWACDKDEFRRQPPPPSRS
jgi:hypothetical protein